MIDDLYFIQKGCHSSGTRISFYFGRRKIVRKIRFEDNCIYALRETDDFDENKLFGIGYWSLKRFPPHHYNSIRVGWLPSQKEHGKIDLFFYLYNKGVRKMLPFYTIQTDKDYYFEIDTDSDNMLYFELKDLNKQTIHYQGTSYQFPKCRWGYKLWFYFGGNKRSPKDMWAYIEKIK